MWATTLAFVADANGTRGRRGSIRILVADDSDETTGRISGWLEGEGYAVVTANSGRRARDAAAVYYPDIVLVDLVLPPPDGLHICALLKKRLAPEIILMTGLADSGQLQRAARIGITGLLRKPITRERVIGSVAAAADRCRRDPLWRLRWHFGMHPRAV